MRKGRREGVVRRKGHGRLLYYVAWYSSPPNLPRPQQGSFSNQTFPSTRLPRQLKAING